MRYFVSDLHYGHTNIIKIQNRPYTSVEEMDEALIAAWNKQVKAGDTVYVIGDFSFHNKPKTEAILSRLKGQKVLIRGNHDERFDTRTFILMGFRDVYNYDIINLGDGLKVVMNHYPYRHPWYKTLWNKLRGRTYVRWYQQFFLKDCGLPLIHGHNHNGPTFVGKSINVAWDVNKRLISETEIKTYLETVV